MIWPPLGWTLWGLIAVPTFYLQWFQWWVYLLVLQQHPWMLWRGRC